MNLAEAVAFLIVRTGATEWRPLRTDRRQVNKGRLSTVFQADNVRKRRDYPIGGMTEWPE